eukprot:scaffold63668_cov58-Phaeocystis_antarctica.AAC.1
MGVTSQEAAVVPYWHFISVPYTYGAPHDSQLLTAAGGWAADGSHFVFMCVQVWPASSNAVLTLSVVVRSSCIPS